MTAPNLRKATYQLYIDWNNDGDFSDDYEDVTSYLLTSPEIRIQTGRDRASAYGEPMVPALDFALNNESRIFSAEYSGSPIRALLRPGRKVKLQATYGYDALMDDPYILMDDPDAIMDEGSLTIDLFTGYLDTLVEETRLGGKIVRIRCLGMMSRLHAIDITMPLYENITTGEAVEYVFTEAGIDPADYDIDAAMISSGRIMSYWYLSEKISAFDVLVDLLHVEGPSSCIWEDGSGVVHVEGRNFRVTNAESNTVQSSFYDTDETPDLFFIDSDLEPSIKGIINSVSIQVANRLLGSSQKVWEYSGSITLSASEVREIFAATTDPIKNPIVPTVTTDFTLGVGSLSSVTINQLSATRVKITLTAGAGGATINAAGSNQGLALRAQPLESLSTLIANNTLDASDSIAEFGEQALPNDLVPWAGIRFTDAEVLADAYINAYMNPRPKFRMTIENVNAAHLRFILTHKPSWRLHVVDSNQSGIDVDVFVEQIEHIIGSGNKHTAILHCEKVVSQDWGIWDDADSTWDDALFGQ